MQVPTRNPGVGMGNMPGVQAGAYADANAFGANNYRDLYDFGGAVHGFGKSVLNEAQHRARDEDDAYVRDANNRAHERYMEESKGIFAKQGRDAENAPAEMDALLQGMRKDIDKTLRNANQQKAFEQSWVHMAAKAKASAMQHRDAEMEKYGQEANLRSTQIASKEASNILAGGGDIDAVLNGPYGEVIRQGVTTASAGRPPETRQLMLEEAMDNFHIENAKAASAVSPEQALKYLDDDRVKNSLSPIKMKALREAYERQGIEIEQREIIKAGTVDMIAAVHNGASPEEVYARYVDEFGSETAEKIAAGYSVSTDLKERENYRMQREAAEKKQEKQQAGKEVLIKSAKAEGRTWGKKSAPMSEIREKAFATFPDDFAEIMIRSAEAERQAMAVDKATKSLEQEEALRNELKNSGNNPLKMPSFGTLPAAQQKRLLALANDSRESPANNTSVDETLYLSAMHDMSAKQLAEIFGDPEKRLEFARKIGGVESQLYTNVANRVKGFADGGTAVNGRSQTFKSLDATLNQLKTEMAVVFADTGRFTGLGPGSNREREEATNRILSYSRNEFEKSMKRHKVDDIDALPLAERDRIIAQALITHQSDELGLYPVYTQAEAESMGIEIRTSIIHRKSLPRQLRKNVVPGGTVRRQLFEKDGEKDREPAFMQCDIPQESAPEKVRDEAMISGGFINRDLASGCWMVVTKDKATEFSPAGERGGSVDLSALPDPYLEAIKPQRKFLTKGEVVQARAKK